MTQFAPLPGSIVGMDADAVRQVALRCEEATERLDTALGEIEKRLRLPNGPDLTHRSLPKIGLAKSTARPN